MYQYLVRYSFLGVIIPPLLLLRYDGLYIMSRCMLWIACWIGIHFASIPVTHFIFQNAFGSEHAICMMIQRIKINASKSGYKKEFYNLRRLLRSQFYCIICSVLGLYLFFSSYITGWPDCWLQRWHPLNSFAFELAVSNWLVACIEDTICGLEVTAHLQLLPNEQRGTLSGRYATQLLLHHLLTMSAYSWSLYTKNLGGLCVFGLLFETPIILTNIRDIIATYEKELNYPYDHPLATTIVKIYSAVLLISFILFRISFSLLWPISLLIWLPNLSKLSTMTQIVYHFLGMSFCYVNYNILTVQLRRCVLDDLLRIKDISKREFLELMHFDNEVINDILGNESESLNHIECGCPVTHQPVLESPHLHNAPQEAAAAATAVAVEYIQSMHTVHNHEDEKLKSNISIYDLETIAKHCTAADAWIIIDDVVYDITNFINGQQHPGGNEVLHAVLGTDATRAFEDIQHSYGARNLLQKFRIGIISTAAAEFKAKHLSGTEENRLKIPPKKILLSAEGTYHIQKEYQIDTHKLLLPVMLASLFTSMMATANFHAITTSDGFFFKGAEFQEAPHPVAAFFSLVMITVIIMTLFFVNIAIIGLFRCNWTELYLSMTSFKEWFLSLQLIGWIVSELALLTDYALIGGLLNEMISLKTILQAYTISLKLSFLLETIHRRAQAKLKTTPSVDRAILLVLTAVRYIETCFDVVCILFTCSIAIDITALHNVLNTSLKVSLNMMQLFNIVLIITIIAFIRCFTLRKLPYHIATTDNIFTFFTSVSLKGLIIAMLGIPLIIVYIQPTGQNSLMTIFEGMKYLMRYPVIAACSCLPLLLIYSTLAIAWSTVAFISQSICFFNLIAFIIVIQWPNDYLSTAAFVMLLLAFVGVSMETIHTLKEHGKSPPLYLCMAKQVEETFRTIVVMIVFALILRPFGSMISFLFPEGIRLFFYPGPVPDLGKYCDYGIAYQVDAKPQPKPTTFILNVGHFGHNSYDYLRTSSSTARMLKEFSDDPAGAGRAGFVSDTVAVFPLFHGKPDAFGGTDCSGFREVNFSCWTSEQAAHDWYVNNETHKSIVKEYHNGGLEEFSAMLSSLRATRPIRWQVRCRNCRLMSDDGATSNGICQHCHEKAITPMPFV